MAKSICSIEGCGRATFAKGWCNPHYKRDWRYGSPLAGAPMREHGDRCSVAGCERSYYGKGFCNFHWLRKRRHGDPVIDLTRARRVGVETCTVLGCDGLMKAKGVCAKHLHRLYRHGSKTARVRGEVVDGRRICKGCGVDTPLDNFASNGSYCFGCAAKKRREWLERHPQPKLPKRECVCEHCGEVFLGDKKHFRFCSTECRSVGQRLRYISGRRARIAGGVVEKFDATDIFERDGWMCQLCEHPLDKTGKPSNPWWPSIDHIIPISRGGNHTTSNAQSAHMACNARKNNALMVELDLPFTPPPFAWGIGSRSATASQDTLADQGNAGR